MQKELLTMTRKTHRPSKKSATLPKRSVDSLVRIRQRIDSVLFVIRLYTRDNRYHDYDDRICILNDELDHLAWLLEK